MGEKKCEQKGYERPENPKYECKKCGRAAKKEGKICKPVKIAN